MSDDLRAYIPMGNMCMRETSLERGNAHSTLGERLLISVEVVALERSFMSNGR